MKIIATFKTENNKLVARWEFDSDNFPPTESELKEVINLLHREVHYAVTGEILNVRNK